MKVRRKEEKLMAQQILIALRNQDRLGQMIPYIERIAQPGMKVVFLIRFHPEASFKRSQGLEEGRSVGELEKQWLAGRRVTETHAIEEQMLVAQHKVFLALEALLKKGIETTVDVYTGSLRRVVKSYTRKGNVALIIKRASAPVMKQFLRTMFPNFAFRRQLALRPIDLLRVNRALS
jgi:hypothetical protein